MSSGESGKWWCWGKENVLLKYRYIIILRIYKFGHRKIGYLKRFHTLIVRCNDPRITSARKMNLEDDSCKERKSALRMQFSTNQGDYLCNLVFKIFKIYLRKSNVESNSWHLRTDDIVFTLQYAVGFSGWC